MLSAVYWVDYATKNSVKDLGIFLTFLSGECDNCSESSRTVLYNEPSCFKSRRADGDLSISYITYFAEAVITKAKSQAVGTFVSIHAIFRLTFSVFIKNYL